MKIADNKWKVTALALVGAWCALYAIKPAWALKPLSTIGITFPDGSALAVSAANTGALRYNNSTVRLEQSINGGSWGALSGGGGGGTLAASYAAGASQTDSTALLDSTRLGVRLRDNATPITGSLFQVQSSAGGSTFFDLTAASTQAIKSGMADGASAVAAAFDTTTAWSNATAKIASFRTNGAEKAYVDAAGDFHSTHNGLYTPDSTGLIVQGTSRGLLVSGSGGISAYSWGGGVAPLTDASYTNGDNTHRWTGTYSSWYDTKLGAQLTAAATITPTTGLHHVTGATTINIIALTNVPTSGNVTITLIADSTVNLGSSASAGGIKLAPTALTSGKAMTFVLDNATQLWYPVQGA